MPRPSLPLLPAQWHSIVFSHQQTQQDNKHQDRALPSVKNLAFIGDAVLQLCVTEWLHDHSSSESTAELLYQRNEISSEMPVEWAKTYKLSSQVFVKTSGDSKPEDLTSKGDLFRAYVAAIYLSGGKEHGLSLVVAWIKELLDIDEEGSNRSNDSSDQPDGDGLGGMLNDLLVPRFEAPEPKPMPQVAPTPGPKAEVQSSRNSLSYLNEKATQKRTQLSWDEVESGPDHAKNWKATLIVEGKEYSGIGHSKKGAKNQAAENALKDLKWI